MSRQFKTAAKNRTTYKYYDANGNIIEIKPGEDGVTEAFINTLHEMDDDSVDAGRREDYHIPGRYEAYCGEDASDEAADRNGWLADDDANPETILIKKLETEERENKLASLSSLLGSVTSEQQFLIDALFGGGLSGRELARRMGISEGAVRKRKNKLLKDLRKNL